MSSIMALADVMVPNGANNSFKESSLEASSRFLMYRFTPHAFHHGGLLSSMTKYTSVGWSSVVKHLHRAAQICWYLRSSAHTCAGLPPSVQI